MGQEHDREYQDMTMKELNKEVTDMSKNSRAWETLYNVKAMHAFVEGGKKTIRIPYFLSKFHMYFQLCIEIELFIMNLTK
jgi:hypothetical protein